MATGQAARWHVRPIWLLLAAVPVALALHGLGAAPLAVFAAACVAIVPLAALTGEATEALADRLGPGVGGLLNATFGNAAELIIALFALAGGQHDLVRASITGSIIGNVLLVVGLAALSGGVFYPHQTFNRTAAGLGATLLALAWIGLLIPTMFHHVAVAHPHGPLAGTVVKSLSIEIAAVLVVVYLLSLVFTLRTHRHLFAGPEHPRPEAEVGWSPRLAVIMLVLAAAGVALMSELLVGSVEPAAAALGWNEVFIGVVVVAVIGNAAEHSTAVMAAVKDRMDLALAVAVGSSIQVALFVAPFLVFASLLMPGPSLDLHFTPLEATAILVAIVVSAMVSQDGETHWMEGVLLLAVYTILGIAFFHLPAQHAP